MAEPTPTKQLVQKSLQANKEHQLALKTYIERLERELKTADKLLSSAEVSDKDEPELDVGGFVLIPGSKKAWSPLRPNDFTSQDSPFREDAERRERYLSFTCIHPMKAKELEMLAEAVRTENSRKYAFEAQQRGQEPFLKPNTSANIETNTEGLDWERIAAKVSSVSSTTRTARECEIRWVGDHHPSINHNSWSQTEITRLKGLIHKLPAGPINWVDIAQELGTRRTPIDCMRHALPRKNHVWDSQSDTRLVEAIKIYGTDNWSLVARHVSEDATAQQCSSRYMRTLDPALKRGAWTPEEDSLLRIAVDLHGNSWMDISAVIPGRNNEQCRLRWLDRLDPNLVKGKWSEEEDKKLLEAVELLGTKWSLVSEQMGNGRTDKVCRLHYELLKKRQQSGPEAESCTTGTPDRVEQEHQDSFSGPRPRPRAGRTLSTATAPEPTSGDNNLPPVQSSRPKPKPRTKNLGEEKEVTVSEDDFSMRSGQPPSEVINKHVPPPRPRPKPRMKGKGKDKEVVAEPVEEVLNDDTPITGSGSTVTDNAIGLIATDDVSLPDGQGAALAAATLTKSARGRKTKEREKSIETGKGKRRAIAEDVDPPPVKKRKAARSKVDLPHNVQEAGATAITGKTTSVRLILPRKNIQENTGPNNAVRTGSSRVTRVSARIIQEASTTDVPPGNVSAGPEPISSAVDSSGTSKRQPDRDAAGCSESAAEDVALSVRGTPALSDLSDLTDLSSDEA